MSILQATHSVATPLRRHTQIIRVGAGAYDTIAEAIAYTNTLVTLSTQNRVRILVDDNIYDEAFDLPQYVDFEGETKDGVILRHLEGSGVSIGAGDQQALVGFHTDSLFENFTVLVEETVDLDMCGIIVRLGETMVTGLVNNALINCDQANHSMRTEEPGYGINDQVDTYGSLHIKSTDFIAGANRGLSTNGYIGLLDFTDCNITGGEQMHSANPWNDGQGHTEYWGVFFGLTYAHTSHNIRPEINFTRCNIKQYDHKYEPNSGMQAFNIEEYGRTGAYTNCIDTNFEIVRWDVDYVGHSSIPLFISPSSWVQLKTYPNAYFGGFFDGCSFTTNSNWTPYYDIRYQLYAFYTIPPEITWGGTGTNPTHGDL